MSRDIVQFIVAFLFFLMLGFPPAVFLATLKIEDPFTGVIVLYEDSCPASVELMRDHHDTQGVIFVKVSDVPRSTVSITDAKSQAETFHSGARVTVGTSASKQAAEYVLSLVAQYGFDMCIPLCIRVYNNKPDRDSAVVGYPNSILSRPGSLETSV